MASCQLEFIRLLKYLIDQGIATQADIARFLNCQPGDVSRWYRGPENGGVFPRKETAENLLPKLKELTTGEQIPQAKADGPKQSEQMRIAISPTGEVEKVISEHSPQYKTIHDLTGLFVSLCKEIEAEQKEIDDRTAALRVKKDQANETLKTLRKVYSLPLPAKGEGVS
jgi:hypothetical protein